MSEINMKKYYRVAELATEGSRQGLLPVSKNTIWRWVRENKFPQPIKLGERTTVWNIEEVNEFIKSKY
jgi:prophage regulatory protein